MMNDSVEPQKPRRTLGLKTEIAICVPLLIFCAVAVFNIFFSRTDKVDTVAEIPAAEPVEPKDADEEPVQPKADLPANANMDDQQPNEDDEPPDQTVDEPDNGIPPAEEALANASNGPPAKEPTEAETAAKKTLAEGPWTAVLMDDAAPDDFDSMAFDDFDTSIVLPRRDDLKLWFEQVPGKKLTLSETRTRVGQCATMSGIGRLKSPWREDTALRLSLEQHNRLKIHFFHADTGVTLVNYQDAGDRWTGYVTQKTAGEFLPKQMSMTATDGWRSRRTDIRGKCTFELRYRDGEIILSRGDVVLLRAPLPDAPDTVLFEGAATFRGIELVRSQGIPAAPPPPEISWDAPRPADLPWEETQLAENASLEKLADGCVRLHADNSPKFGWAITPLASDRIQEVIFEITGATPGTGIFLGRSDHVIRESVRFVRDTRSGQVIIAWQAADDVFERSMAPINDRPLALAADRQWIRLLFSGGAMRWWISTDGLHWAEPEPPRGYQQGEITHIGLCHVARRPNLQLTLRRVFTRLLPGLNSLAPVDLLENVPVLNKSRSLDFWIAEATETQPEGVDLNQWRRACAVRAIASGCQTKLGNALVEQLLADGLEEDLPTEKKLALLQEASLLLFLRDDNNLYKRMLRRYWDFAMEEFSDKGVRPFSLIRHALLTSPMETPYNDRIADPDVVLAEMEQLVYTGQWSELEQFCQQLKYFGFGENIALTDWAAALAESKSPGRARGTLTTKRKSEWEHPFIEDLDKATYNVLAELRAMLESDANGDAARTIMSLDDETMRGLAPAGGDSDWLLSLPAAVQAFLEAYPALREEINSEYGPIATLRIRQAIKQNNVDAVELATLQFAGAEACAEAYQWLGDRALSSGWFSSAVADYDRAFEIAGPSARLGLLPRIRLAAAMLGKDNQEPVTRPVSWGDIQMTAEEFEALVAEMVARESVQRQGSSRHSVAAVTVPEPTGIKAESRGQLDRLLGREPDAELIPNGRQFDIDWAGRQIGVAVDGKEMFVSNRFHVAAYDLTNGQRRWQSQTPASQPMKSQDWGLVPMRPLVSGSHIYVRMLYDQGPLLVCLDKANGQLVWSSESRGGQFVVSDPILMQQRLAALMVSQQEQGEYSLQIATFDQATGHAVRRHDLVRLNDTWMQRRYCEVAAFSDGLVAALGGAVVCCDLSGNVKWVRQVEVMPASEYPRWVQQVHQPPLIIDGRLYVSQPGTPLVECLELATGALHWQKVLPNVERIIGQHDGHIIVQSTDGFRALDQADGHSAWHRREQRPNLHGALVGREAMIYGRQRPQLEGSESEPELAWLDLATGKPMASSVIPDRRGTGQRLGPLIMGEGKLWSFYNQPYNEAKRELIELTPDGTASKPYEVANAWARHIPDVMHAGCERVMPGWRIFSTRMVSESPIKPEQWGQQDVLETQAHRSTPVTIGRRIEFPDRTKPKLRIMVGATPSKPWKLIVRFAGKVIYEKDIKSDAFPKDWKTVEVDAAKLGGKSGWVMIDCQFSKGNETVDLYWKRIETVF